MNRAADPALHHHDGRLWCALHTRSRHEKKLAAACATAGMPHYLPLRARRCVSGRKVLTFEVPLFAGYVFAALAPGDLRVLRTTNAVANRLAPSTEMALLDDLGRVRTVLSVAAEVDDAPVLAAGKAVVVASGPLAGMRGTVVRHRNRTRLLIAIETIARGVVVDVPRDALVAA